MDNASPETIKKEPINPDFDLNWNPRAKCPRADVHPEFRKVLNMPSDTIEFDILPFPVITIKAERVPMNAKGNASDAFADLLDVIITDRLLPYHPNAKQESHSVVGL
ncbi:hypothetical protein O1611_g10627 [Lasiodiplodia mahajangana]|uniref:Uncharacterized protein n=1 Tax=Lasiodiplodia mahajangana TaxID=1108764 RepID=A0ACC2IVY4_9PEZI|nr:hypothetical protein O1611_g10627 [Lasiodiplodia mahajangana]